MPQISKTLQLAYDSQDLAARVMYALRNELDQQIATAAPISADLVQRVSSCIQSLERAQERVRIARGKPLPTAQGLLLMRKLNREIAQAKRGGAGGVWELEPAATSVIEDAQPAPVKDSAA